MSTQDTNANKSVEFCELRCPHLLIAVIQATQSLEPGQLIQIRATDLNAPSSIASWSRQSGNKMLDMYEENGCFVFLLECNGQNMVPFEAQGMVDKLSKEG